MVATPHLDQALRGPVTAMHCSHCGKDVSFYGRICPYCHADKRPDRLPHLLRWPGTLTGVYFGGAWGMERSLDELVCGVIIGFLLGRILAAATAAVLPMLWAQLRRWVAARFTRAAPWPRGVLPAWSVSAGYEATQPAATLMEAGNSLDPLVHQLEALMLQRDSGLLSAEDYARQCRSLLARQ